MKSKTKWYHLPHFIPLGGGRTLIWFFRSTGFVLELRTKKWVREFAAKYERWERHNIGE